MTCGSCRWFLLCGSQPHCLVTGQFAKAEAPACAGHRLAPLPPREMPAWLL